MRFPTGILVGLVALTYLYVISFHRIRSVEDASKAISVARLAAEDHRCKIFNTTHFICLPNVFFIGASKCGTTSVMDYLLLHPNVTHVKRRISPIDKHKEVHRFDRNSYGWSFNFIELADEWASSPLVPSKNVAVIHYTPHYLYAPTVPFEMRKFYPNPETLKFVVIIRDPIERALSSYWFQRSHLFRSKDGGSIDEFEKLCISEMSQRKSYEECMEEQKHIINKESGTLLSPSSYFIAGEYSKSASCNASCMKGFQSPGQHFQALKQCFGRMLRSPALGSRHLDKGIYYDQLLRWWDNFPSKNFHVTSLENWTKNASAEYDKLISFIFRQEGDVKSASAATASVTSVSASQAATSMNMFEHKRLVKPNKISKQSDQQLSPHFRQKLEKFYRPYQEQLRSLIDIDSLMLSAYS